HLEGRQQVCYRCKGSGHIKKDCKVLKCRVCKSFRHDDPDCHVHASYANITRVDDVDSQVKDQDVNYEEQGCSAGSHDTHMTPSKNDGSDCDHSGHGFNEPLTSLSCKSQPTSLVVSALVQPSPADMQNTVIEPVTPPTIVEKNQQNDRLSNDENHNSSDGFQSVSNDSASISNAELHHVSNSQGMKHVENCSPVLASESTITTSSHFFPVLAQKEDNWTEISNSNSVVSLPSDIKRLKNEFEHFKTGSKHLFEYDKSAHEEELNEQCGVIKKPNMNDSSVSDESQG
ncbi:unnamed protein product, partial [Didymodactylos carnosus]